MMAPYWVRMVMFIWACISATSFGGQFLTLVYEYFRGNRALDTYAEIISFYIMVLRAADLVPSLYVLLFEGLA